MAKDHEPQLRLAVQCPRICEHVSDKDNIEYTISPCATNSMVTIIWEFKCKICHKIRRMNQTRFAVVVLVDHLKPAEKSRTLTTVKPSGPPSKPYDLGAGDRNFLRSMRITPE